MNLYLSFMRYIKQIIILSVLLLFISLTLLAPPHTIAI